MPGTTYALLLSRSVDFKRYRDILELEYYNWRDIRIAITVMQMLWDVGEAAGISCVHISQKFHKLITHSKFILFNGGWLQSMNQNPSVGVPKKDVLLQGTILQ